MRSIGVLATNRMLWTLFTLMLLLSIMFPLLEDLWQLSLLDKISDPDKVRETIGTMSGEQRLAHSWITATLDVVYPVVYGAFFIGCAYAFWGRFGRYVAIPFFVLVPIDLMEGLVQVLALNGSVDWVDAKAYLTPVKFGLVLFGIFIAVAGSIGRMHKQRKKQVGP